MALISFFPIKKYFAKSRDTKRKGQLHYIRSQINDYYYQHGCYPTSLDDNYPHDPSTKEKYGYEVDNISCPTKYRLLTNLELSDDPSIKSSGCVWGCGNQCNYNFGYSSTNIKVNIGCITQYACSPSQNCIAFEDPTKSQCPVIFENDPLCGNRCTDRNIRCHDESGKQTSSEEFTPFIPIEPTPTSPRPTSTPPPTPTAKK